eukprot:SAG31_NODE_1711_length_7472_cov_2.107555_6_plen_100_part_00
MIGQGAPALLDPTSGGVSDNDHATALHARLQQPDRVFLQRGEFALQSCRQRFRRCRLQSSGRAHHSIAFRGCRSAQSKRESELRRQLRRVGTPLTPKTL